ncbi:hypothetical protein BP00DRAFT_34785 [Aspergillus indologenus CBS 114.80]|uniref:Uncharacterized protein n=1 Tax=Aspergillus indologenus CBS 114.80 TaxID=1450541 RepID=A0A2V5IT15_9EURO|nr:hypothetical protein BP00DRAFT_34785 [Aspergillus indologenus CBS 114.80]
MCFISVSFKPGSTEGLSHIIRHHKRNQSTKYKVQRKPFQHHHHHHHHHLILQPPLKKLGSLQNKSIYIQINQTLEWG